MIPSNGMSSSITCKLLFEERYQMKGEIPISEYFQCSPEKKQTMKLLFMTLGKLLSQRVNDITILY